MALHFELSNKIGIWIVRGKKINVEKPNVNVVKLFQHTFHKIFDIPYEIFSFIVPMPVLLLK